MPEHGKTRKTAVVIVVKGTSCRGKCRAKLGIPATMCHLIPPRLSRPPLFQIRRPLVVLIRSPIWTVTVLNTVCSVSDEWQILYYEPSDQDVTAIRELALLPPSGDSLSLCWLIFSFDVADGRQDRTKGLFHYCYYMLVTGNGGSRAISETSCTLNMYETRVIVNDRNKR